MQIMGNPVSSWELTAHASRTIVALGYHQLTKTVPENDLDREIFAALAHCAQFDSVMSLLLLRPRSLPPLHVKVSELLQTNPNNPMNIFELAALEMVPVNDKILDLTLEATAKRSPTALKQDVARLRKQMIDIRAIMEKVIETASHVYML